MKVISSCLMMQKLYWKFFELPMIQLQLFALFKMKPVSGNQIFLLFLNNSRIFWQYVSSFCQFWMKKMSSHKMYGLNKFETILVVIDRLWHMSLLIKTHTTAASMDLAHCLLSLCFINLSFHQIFSQSGALSPYPPSGLLLENIWKFLGTFWKPVKPTKDVQNKIIKQILAPYPWRIFNHKQDNWSDC